MAMDVGKTILLAASAPLAGFSDGGGSARRGWSVVLARSGQEAVERALAEPPVDLVLMDLDLLGGMDGAEAATRILEQRDLPIVFLLERDGDGVAERALQVPNYGCMPRDSGAAVLDAAIGMAFRLHEANRSVKESEARLRSLYDHMVEGTALHELLFDREGRPVDYRILEVNPSFEVQLGLPGTSIVGKTSREAYGVEEPPYLDVYARVASGGRAEIFDTYFPAMDKWFSISAYRTGPRRFATVFQDITKRKLAELGLRKSEANLEVVLAAVYEGILAVDGDRHVIASNARFREIWGVPSALVNRGKELDIIECELPRIADPETFVSRIEELYSSDREGQDLILLKDGRTIERFSMPLFLDGKPSGRVWSFRDITERRRSEESIRRLLEEKDLILKEVHHRIKNNMNTINGFLLLQAEKAREPAAVSALRDASMRVRGMTLLYDKLYRAKSFTRIPVRDYLGALVDEIVLAFPGADRITVDKELGDFSLDVRPLQSIGIVLNELLTNCMKYAFVGRDRGRILVGFSLRGGRALLVVADDGIGMPEGVEFSASPGFGLDLVAGMAGQLEGGVRLVRSGGTRIELDFPVPAPRTGPA